MSSPALASVVNDVVPGTILPSVLNSVQVVGGAWMLSSTLFTTYLTTSYLKYKSNTTPSQLQLENVKRGKPSLSRATVLTLLRFSGSLFLGLVAHPNLKVLDRIRETWQLLPKFALPAVFLFIANYSNAISLNRIGISLTYTSKCAIPVITLILTVLLDGVEALPNIPVLLSLATIALGIATSSWNHPTFETWGFLAAFISCAAQSALNVTCKKVMSKMNVAGPVAQRAMVTVGLAIASAVSLTQVLMSSSSRKDGGKESDESSSSIISHPPVSLGLMAATAYHVEYFLSFTFVKLVAPISYSACDAVRRLGIIISGHFMFGGPPFTVLNILGIALSLGGALAYSVLNNR